MAFCKFSTELVANNKTEIDNVFIDSFMPSAPEECTKCYLYGLFLASNGLKMDNTLENFAKKLNNRSQRKIYRRDEKNFKINP